ncbi:MAG: hemolysin family protein [Myxococcaceae bacterium]
MKQEYLFLLLALLLVIFNGFFVAFEFAIVKVRRSRLESLAQQGNGSAVNALRIMDRLDSYLSLTQFGVTLASLGLGWLGEPAFAAILQPLLVRVFPDSAAQAAHTVAIVVGFAVITFLHIILGELGPKSFAIQKAEETALALAWPMRFFHLLFLPGVALLNASARKLLSLFGLGAASESSSEAHNEEELRFILQSSAESGVISTHRAELLERALSMAEKTARQVLVPRSQVMYLDLEESLEKNIADARASGHTWIPVCRGNLDQVEGVVNVMDLFYLLSRGELQSIGQVQRPVLFVPETATLEQLLAEFRRRRRQMAIVVDEHGGTSGIVTISDVVAEVVGDIAELGRKKDEVKSLPGGRLELPGTTQLDDLQDRLDVKFDIEQGEVATIAGYLMAKLSRIPERGDKVSVGEFDVIVEEMDGPRVVKVRVQPRTVAAPTGTPAGAGTTTTQ